MRDKLEPIDSDREVMIVIVGEHWRNQIYAGSFDGDERFKTIVRHRQEGFRSGVHAGIDTAARAFRSAQYEPAPYTQGMAALRKIEPDAVAPIDREQQLEQALKGAREALKASTRAIDNWLNTYASDACEPDRVAEARTELLNGGGTLFYIASIQGQARQALAKIDAVGGT